MRIIVTKNGKIIIREIENSSGRSEEKISERKNKSLFGLYLPELKQKFSSYRAFYENRRKPKWGVKYRYKSLISNKSMIEFYNRDETKIDDHELKQAKNIKLSQSKINLSQQFLGKYYDLDEIYKTKLNNLSKALKSSVDKKKELKFQNKKEDQKQMDFFMVIDKDQKKDEKSIKHVLLGDIISRNNLLNLKSQVIKDYLGYDDIRIPLDNKNKNSYNFRSKYEDKNATFANLSVILNMPMKTDRTNLINYYRQKKNISPFYFENLTKYSDAHIYKLNKICQMMFHKKEEEMKDLQKMKLKKLIKDKNFRLSGNNNLIRVNKIMDKTSGIIFEYNLKKEICEEKKKSRLKEDLKRIKKYYWKKYGINHLCKENRFGQSD